MKSHIRVIVVTGGPGGGKTTAMNIVRQKLEDLGYLVLIIPEVATELLGAGVSPKILGRKEFQCQVLRYVIERERRYRAIARAAKHKVVVLCDRGTMDSAAYVTRREFNSILGTLGLGIVDLRDGRYDGVIFLRTPALDKPEVYTTANNAVRSETPEEAIAVDERTHDAWVGTPHLVIIDNSTDMEGKAHRVFQEVCHILGEPIPLEIERKFLVKDFDRSQLPRHTQRINIEQTYLRRGSSGRPERVRARSQFGITVYYHTIKEPVGNGVRTEVERRIKQKDYDRLMLRANPSCGTIRKVRHCFSYKDQRFELDIFEEPAGLVLLELEVTSMDQEVKLPPFLGHAVDVTDDPNYGNREIAKSLVRIAA